MDFRRTFGQVFGLETTIAAAVFGLVAAVMLAAFLVSRHRRRRGSPPSGRAGHNRLETGYVLALAGMAAFLITASLSSNAHESAAPTAAFRVRVTAFQWCWRFSYPAQGVAVTGQCASGTESTGSGALPAPGKLPTLVLPAGRPVQVQVESRDVVHSFWVPALRYKIDAFPGHVNSFTVTLPRSGRWMGRCAEFCGLYHYGMEFYLQAVPPARFTSWVHAHARGPAVAGGR